MLPLTYAVAPRRYPLARTGNFGLVAWIAAGLVAALGCAAGVKPNQTGAGGTLPLGSGGAGGGGFVTGLGGVPFGLGGALGLGGADPDAASCVQFEVEFKPKTPTVVMLVDRSTSMFPCLGSTDMRTFCAVHSNTSWDKLRVSLLQVIQTLQADSEHPVRIGFVTYTGIANGTCPMLNKVAPAVDSYGAISALYESLPWPSNQAGDKWETPTVQSLTAVGADLLADNSVEGDKYILLATDGAPDYCDDGNSLCPPDAVIGKLQSLNAAGIKTIVFGLQSPVNDLPTTTLQAFANAGAGDGTLAPLRTGLDATAFWDQCNSDAHWKADIVAKYPECANSANFNTCRGHTIGTYDTTMGPSHAYIPAAGDQAMLVQQLTGALAGVKSCTFDLTGHKVNTQRLGEAVIKMDGTVIPLDPNNANGWNMSSSTQLDLHGPACDNWRAPTATKIDFGFPCDIIVD